MGRTTANISGTANLWRSVDSSHLLSPAGRQCERFEKPTPRTYPSAGNLIGTHAA